MNINNQYKTARTDEIHNIVVRSQRTDENEIRDLLRNTYSENEINQYLDYRYQEKVIQRLQPKAVNPTVRIVFILSLGFALLAIHYLAFDATEFSRTVDSANNFRPGAALGYAVFYGILYYVSFYAGLTLLALSLWHLYRIIFLNN